MKNINLSIKELTLLILAFGMGGCALIAPSLGGKELQLVGAALGVISGGAFIGFLYLKLFKNDKPVSGE